MENKVYKLESITMTDSVFNRNAKIDFSAVTLNNHVDIEVEDNIVDDKLIIAVALTVSGTIDDVEQYNFFNRFVGVFEIGNTNELPMERFAKTNGPAIIFPFIREHVATTSLKANLNPVMLPPINFVKLSQEAKIKSD